MGVHRFEASEVRPFRWSELTEEASRAASQAPGEGPPEAPAEPGPEELLEAARAEAEALLSAARSEAQELREEARREGLEGGLAEGRALAEEAAGRWQALAEELAGYRTALYDDARAQVVELCLSLVQKILGPLAESDAQTVIRVASQALQALSDRDVLTIRVHPADLQGLLEAKPHLLQTFDGIKKLTVIEDPSVGQGGCLVETPTAEIDARLDSQLRELVRNVKKP